MNNELSTPFETDHAGIQTGKKRKAFFLPLDRSFVPKIIINPFC
jgi:hypothetical protein